MASFGGAIKMKGESEYRAALRKITQNLKEVSSEMKLVASQYDNGDASTQALTAKQNVLNDKLGKQKQLLSTLQTEYAKMGENYAKNTQKHESLVKSYEEEQSKLDKIEQELGKSSKEYKTQSAEVAKLAKDVSRSTNAQNANTNAMSKMREQMNNAQADINKTQGEIKELGSQMEKLNSAQNRTVSEMEKLGATIEQQKSKLAGLKSEYANAVLTYGKNSAEAKNLGTQIKSLSSELQKNEAQMNDANKQADNLASGFDNLDKSARGSAGGGFTVLKGALANLAGNVMQTALNGIQNLAGEAINSSDALKKFESTMNFAGYDDAQIQKARDSMKDYADKTVYDLNTIANTTAQLASNGIQDYTGLTEAAGNLNAVAGGNADTFQSVAMVLTQTAGAGKLTTENWNQLANAIPGASGKLQEALLKNGAYTGNFRDAMAQGQITADEFNQAIMDLGFTDAAQEAATSTQTFEGAMGNMQAAVTDGLMQIYEAIGSENVTGFINGISDFVANVVPPIKDGVTWFIDNLPTIAPLIAGIAGALGGIMVAEKITALVTSFQTWKTATEGMTIAQQILNAVMSANPLGIVLAAVGALAAGIAVLWNTNEGFRTAVTDIWQNLKDVVGGAIDNIIGFFTNLGTNIETLKQMFSDGLNNIINFVKNWVLDMAFKAEQVGRDFVINIIKFVRNLPANIAGFLSNIISNVTGWVTSMASNAISAGSKFLTNVVKFLSQLPQRVINYVRAVISSLRAWVTDMGSKGAEGARSMFDSVVNGIKDLPNRVYNIGSDIVTGVWNGISGAAGWLAEKVSGFATGILDGMKNALGIHSPSRLFRDEVGKYIAQGVGVGFEKEMRNVTADMQNAIPDPSAFVSTPQAAYSGYTTGGIVANADVVGAVVEALERVHIVLDDEVAGKFVERTVTNAIYA